MCTGGGFACFGALPPELRLQVWERALSVWTVWAVVRNSIASSRLGASRSSFTIALIGPAPYLAGQSCREARQLLERSSVKPVRGDKRFSDKASKSYGLDLVKAPAIYREKLIT